MAKQTFQGRIFLYSTLTIVVIGFLMTLLGAYLISKTVFHEAQIRVNMDLRAARAAYTHREQAIRLALDLVSEKTEVLQFSAQPQNLAALEAIFKQKRAELGLDFLSLCNPAGQVVARSRAPYRRGDFVTTNFLIQTALTGASVSGKVILNADQMQLEGDGLSEQAFIQFLATPKEHPNLKTSETSGMFLMAAVPVRNQNNDIVGALYGGILLNRNYGMVDEIRDLAFSEKTYKKKEFGTVTIFQWDVRIATNVLKTDGERAIGTRVSEEVYNQVLINKKPWHERAFVVHDWYISAYEPILDPEQKVIGILYVGLLEQKYIDLRNQFIFSFIPLLVLSLIVTLLFSYLLANKLSRHLKHLVVATQRLEAGDMDYRIEDKAKFIEFDQLRKHFNHMAQAVKDRDAALSASNEDLRRVNRNYMEILGFVSHEMKNALANMLGSAYNLRDEVVGELNQAQKAMTSILIRNLERLRDMIKNYLDLSRIEKGELEARKQLINFQPHVLAPVLEELAGPMELKGVKLALHIPPAFQVKADPDLLKIIIENLLSNAVKYGRDQGKIEITAEKTNNKYQLSVWNEGEGIPKEELDSLFSKFKRLKTETSKREKGSGLGLFITKEMVTKQGGEIWAESELGQWVRFTFTLPAST